MEAAKKVSVWIGGRALDAAQAKFLRRLIRNELRFNEHSVSTARELIALLDIAETDAAKSEVNKREPWEQFADGRLEAAK